jgi:hypothetical protein
MAEAAAAKEEQGGAAPPALIEPLVWNFLPPRCSAAKSLPKSPWIFLDFLGFSRPNHVFSMGYPASRANLIC